MSSPNDMEDLFLKAHQAWDSGELSLALNIFSECAARSDVGSMVCVGYFHDEGLGIPVDKRVAMYWYKKAYRRGDSSAACNIAILYREQQRFNLTAHWFRRAVKMADGDAELELAKLYISGKGVRKSASIARMHLANAACSRHITEAGREEAQELLETLENDTNYAIKPIAEQALGSNRTILCRNGLMRR